MESLNIDQVVEAFIDVLGSARSSKTVRWYQDKLERLARFLRESGLPTTMQEIRPEHVARFFHHLRETAKTSDETLRGYRIAIRCLWRWFYENEGGGAKVDPLRGLPSPMHSKRVPDTLSDTELEQLLAAANTQRDFVILLTLLGTGMRAGELVNLRLDDVDRKASRILIRHAGYRDPAGTKQNCERFVPLKDSLRGILADYVVRTRPRIVPDGTPWLFSCRDGQPLTTEGLYRLVRRCLERAGIHKRQMGPHLLRRTFASRLRASGAPKSDVAELLGHSESTGMRVVNESYLSTEANEQALAAAPDPLASLALLFRGRRRR